MEGCYGRRVQLFSEEQGLGAQASPKGPQANQWSLVLSLVGSLKYLEKTFTKLTVRLSNIRCMWAIAAQLKCKVYQMDIKTAYLNAAIDEDIYLEQPEGFNKGKGLYCHLLKSLYGLKQSGRNWYKLLSNFLVKLGFQPSKADQCLFVKVINNVYYYVAIWVDDIIYFSADPGFHNAFQQQMATEFTIGECGELNWFLGMKISCQPGRIEASQEQYIEALLKRFGMQDCKASSTPTTEKQQLTKDDCPAEGSQQRRDMETLDYRGLVGSLNYLATTTRPDISFICHVLSSFLHNPGMSHWVAAKHVLRYLRGTPGHSLTYLNNSGAVGVYGAGDSDYAGNMDSRRSTTGYSFKLLESQGSVSWASRLQKTVATSTTEAEIFALTDAVKEGLHLTTLMGDCGYSVVPKILCDSQSTIAIVKRRQSLPKTKHYAVRLAYLFDLFESNDIYLDYIQTDRNYADLFTKGLGKIKHSIHTNSLLFGTPDLAGV